MTSGPGARPRGNTSSSYGTAAGTGAAANGSSAPVGPGTGTTGTTTLPSPAGNGLIGTGTAGTGVISTASRGAMPNEICSTGMATTAPITPTVWLVVDGSSSMNDRFDTGRSRWDTLRSTLIDPGGVVDSLQSVVKFGMVIYSGGGEDPAQCVKLVTVQPALNNLANLTASYGTTPLGQGTPTDKALEHVVTTLPVLNQQVLDTKANPIYVVLATDGAPNDCGGRGGLGGILGGTAGSAEMRVLDVTTRGTAQGMNMFVVSLAGGDAELQRHLEQVAMATTTKTAPYVPATQNELVMAFRQIVGSASCQVGLSGTVTAGRECSGNVELNGAPLSCNQPDGFRLSDPRTVQLTGKACETFLSVDSEVIARFACDAFTPD